MKLDRDYWNGNAGDKWVAFQPMMDAILAPFAEAILDAAELPAEGTVVDVGCGCGATTLMAAERQPGLRVIWVDVSSPMLAHAEQRARARSLPVDFVCADAGEARPVEGGAARVLSRFGVMFFPDPLAAFANLRRWLAPEGRLVATIWGPVAENPWTAELLALLRRHLEVPDPPEDVPGPFGLSNRERVEAILRAAGFSSVQQDDLSIPMRIEGSREEVLRFHTERGLFERTLAEADEATREAVRGSLREFIGQRYDGTGITLGARARLLRASA